MTSGHLMLFLLLRGASKTRADVVASVLTTLAGDRFTPQPPLPWVTDGDEGDDEEGVLTFDATARAQAVFGFGTALTESAAYNFAALSPPSRRHSPAPMAPPVWRTARPRSSSLCTARVRRSAHGSRLTMRR